MHRNGAEASSAVTEHNCITSYSFIVIAGRRAADIYVRPTPTARNVRRLPNSCGTKIRRASITTGVAMD